MANDIIDINVYETTETVEITVNPNLTTVNINQVTGGGGGGDTDLAYTPSPTNGIVTSSTGTDATIPLADATNAGLLTAAEKTKIANIPTATNQITNNGADGVNPFITALDIPTQNQASTLVREVKNMTGATLTKGTVVYISGANGNKALVSKALATTDALSSRTFGMLQSDILNNGLGNCVIIGDLTGVDTSSFAEGSQLYLSGTTAGTYTSTKNLAPTHLVYVGKVTRVHPTQGQIEVGIQNGYELEEIHDCQIVTPTNNQALIYESSTDLWKNKDIIINDSDFATTENTFSSSYFIDSLNGLLETNAYTFRANNTNGTAVGQFQAFKNLTNQVYSGTIVWTGGSAPTIPTNTYSLSQIGNLVTLIVNLSYANAGGGTLTSVAFELPNTAPTPALPTSVTSVGNVISYGSGTMTATKQIQSTLLSFCALRIKSTGVYEIAITRSVGTYTQAYATIQYFV
jgi:ribosomal protein L35AE/L33A